jgi:hypothetical protein
VYGDNTGAAILDAHGLDITARDITVGSRGYVGELHDDGDVTAEHPPF